MPDAMRARVNEFYSSLDPVAFLRDIRATQERLARLTDAPPASDPSAPPPIDQFLASLRTAWMERGRGPPGGMPGNLSDQRAPDASTPSKILAQRGGGRALVRLDGMHARIGRGRPVTRKRPLHD